MTSVLVIDDEPAVGVVLGRMLCAHAVTVVTSGREAIDLLSAGQSYDVILSDMMMPQMSGMDLYEEIMRSWPDTARRMVFVTGGAFTPAANAFLDAVPNHRLEKPFDITRVRALIAGVGGADENDR